jgi:nicotinate-nucleotide adenylyltransferase
MERGLTIGLLGGSFNPAHEGHLHVCALALKQLRLDYVWWLVSPQNPLKGQEGMAPFATRLASAGLFARHPKILVTGIENQLGTRFTLDTVKALKRRFPHVRFVWLMGSDNFVQLPRWRSWKDIVRAIPIAIVTRPGTALAARNSKAAIRFKNRFVPANARFARRTPPAITTLDAARRNPISATAIRSASRG